MKVPTAAIKKALGTTQIQTDAVCESLELESK